MEKVSELAVTQRQLNKWKFVFLYILKQLKKKANFLYHNTYLSATHYKYKTNCTKALELLYKKGS